MQRILVIGGGPAAVCAAIEARKANPAVAVTLVTNEDCEPYEKPPLSKAVLLGKSNPEDALIAGPGGLARHGISLEISTRCIAIDRLARRCLTTNGSIAYDALVIATGAIPRELPLFPMGMPRVHYLRTETDARSLRAALLASKRLAVIGAGLIGLEVAATAAELGLEVKVFDIAERIMARTCDEETGSLIRAEHHARGVEFEMATLITGASSDSDGSLLLNLNNSKVHRCDLVLVGAGVVTNDSLAAVAGVTVQDGIVVDAQCRTSDPHIFAAGDVTRFVPSANCPFDTMIRLENWLHAQRQGIVAGRNAAGYNESYVAVPSFWTEQYGLYIQGIGWPTAGAMRVRRQLGNKGTLLLETSSGKLTYALGVNAQREIAAIRRLIERNIPIDFKALADPSVPFNTMLKTET